MWYFDVIGHFQSLIGGLRGLLPLISHVAIFEGSSRDQFIADPSGPKQNTLMVGVGACIAAWRILRIR